MNSATDALIIRLRNNDPQLTEFRIANQTFGNAGAMAIALHLPNNTYVKDIMLDQCDIGEEGLVDIFKGLEQNSSVISLDSGFNQISKKAMLALSQLLRVNQNLAELYLVNTNLHDLHVSILADGLRDNRSVDSLNLRENSIGDDGAITLLKVLESRQKKIWGLFLDRNKIGFEGAKKIAHFVASNDPVLFVLGVTRNSFGAEGNTLIAKSAESNMKLISLYFDGNAEEISFLNFYTSLNAAGRRSFLKAANMGPSDWADKLAKVGKHSEFGTSMIYYLLRERLDLLCGFLAQAQDS